MLNVDAMHDFLQGVCHYDLSQCINAFIYTEKLFTLELMNIRILNHNFGSHVTNKPSIVTEQMIKNKHFKFTAVEMLVFMMHFPLIIGDLIPIKNEMWSFLILLREILSIVFADEIHPNYPILLKYLIEQHHILYIKFFGALKPKHHLMVHYPRIMELIGPLRSISSLRFESKHQFFKKVGMNTNCRKNLLLTLAIKHQLHFANMIVNYAPVFTFIKEGPSEVVEKKYFEDIFFVNFDHNDQCLMLSNLTLNNIKYNLNDVIKYDSFEDDTPAFGLITHILKVKEDYIFCLKLFGDCGFDEHYSCYEVKILNNHSSVVIQNLKSSVKFCINKVNDMHFINYFNR